MSCSLGHSLSVYAVPLLRLAMPSSQKDRFSVDLQAFEKQWAPSPFSGLALMTAFLSKQYPVS